MPRPTIKTDGTPLTDAERQKRYKDRIKEEQERKKSPSEKREAKQKANAARKELKSGTMTDHQEDGFATDTSCVSYASNTSTFYLDREVPISPPNGCFNFLISYPG